MTSKTPILDQINSPQDLRKLEDTASLEALACELRREMIETVAVTGGHLGAGLGVVELTIALHKVFDTPHDKLIWDVGHQAYPHKILTGRRKRMASLRQEGGLSGFTKRDESPYDPFGAGHSSTSISAALGMATARDLAGRQYNVVAVIGDGAMSAGMAYEAMNNAGAADTRLIVILNDNDMSIAPPVGALSAYFARLTSGGTYLYFRDIAKQLAKKLPRAWEARAARAEEYTRGMVAGGTLFEEMGFYYVGPIDGHNFDHLLPVLRNVRDNQFGPVLVHVVTRKGKGYEPAERSADKFHGVGRFNVVTGAQEKNPKTRPSYTSVFSDQLIEEAARDDKIVAITAAMPGGTGLDKFAKAYPERCFDVGIAEQHAVTFAAGLAAEGYKPFAAIYSTFLQRAYDQVVHDVAIQRLPVRFAIDRAGLVGADGPTHAGIFDIAYLTNLPGFVVMAAANDIELRRMVKTAALYDEGPIAFRYPRGEVHDLTGWTLQHPDGAAIEPLEIGKGRIARAGRDIAFLSYGARLQACLQAAERLTGYGLSPTVADARFAAPLDGALIERLAHEHDVLITVEEGVAGGFGAAVLKYATDCGLLDHGSLKLRSQTLPDRFLPHGDPERQYENCGLGAKSLTELALDLLNLSSSSLKHPAS